MKADDCNKNVEAGFGAAPLLGRFALLHTNSWAGHRTQRVEVLKRGPKQTLITTADAVPVRLPGRSRQLPPGDLAWVRTDALSAA